MIYSLILPVLAFALTLALMRALYYQIVVMRFVGRATTGDGERTGSPMQYATALMHDPEHRSLRRTWLASWVWTAIALFVFLFWVFFF